MSDVGKQRIPDRGRRHFPRIHNRAGLTTFTPHGRKYIPHNYGRHDEWTPHAMFVDIEYTKCGPDWESSLRCLPHHSSPQYPAAEIFPDNWKSIRPFPYTYMRSRNEWMLDPDHMRVGMKCFFDGQHKATDTTDDELTHSLLFGRNRKLESISTRNNIPEASPGDKSYQAAEYSPLFHHLGSTRPTVPFSKCVSVKRKPDTFVPLYSMSTIPRETYKHREEKRLFEEDATSVRRLDDWKPATPLPQTLILDDKK